MNDFYTMAIALSLILALIAYALLGGADFGGGVWDLFAAGPRKHDQRKAVHHAMGPVWEANHVWLIFVIVVLFTCFPQAFSPLVTALFIPLHLALLGIMLRGAAFVFHSHGRDKPTLPGEHLHHAVWQTVFGASSLITPFFLGASFGAVSAGGIRVDPAGQLAPGHGMCWLTTYCLCCGALAVAASSYLAAVYLCVETKDTPALREDFRKRAVFAGTCTAALAAVTLLAAYFDAPWFFSRLITLAAPIFVGGLVAFALSAWAVFTRRYKAARVFAAGEILLMLVGWSVAQHPYVVYPDLPLSTAAAPPAMMRFMTFATTAGMAILIPSLVALFRVFKSDAATPAKTED